MNTLQFQSTKGILSRLNPEQPEHGSQLQIMRIFMQTPNLLPQSFVMPLYKGRMAGRCRANRYLTPTLTPQAAFRGTTL